MDRKYIDNDVSIDMDVAEWLCDNCETGDAMVALYKGVSIEREETEYWLETNGNPVRIHQGNLVDAATDVDLSAAALSCIVGFDAE